MSAFAKTSKFGQNNVDIQMKFYVVFDIILFRKTKEINNNLWPIKFVDSIKKYFAPFGNGGYNLDAKTTEIIITADNYAIEMKFAIFFTLVNIITIKYNFST